MPIPHTPALQVLAGSTATDPMLQRPKAPTKGRAWLSNQDFNYEDYATGTAPNHPGTISGGFNVSQLLRLSDLRRELVLPEPPRMTQSVLNGKGSSALLKTGQFQLEMVQPFDSLTQGTGSTLGLEQPLVGTGGSWFDPMGFLESKDLTLGFETPSRLSDYALNTTLMLPFLAAQTAMGAPPTTPNMKDQKYKFQESRSYWSFVGGATDDQLRQLARDVTSKYANPDGNQYIVDKFYNQFLIDRGKTTHLTSGSDSADYFAKKGMAWSIHRGGDGLVGEYAASQGYLYDAKGEQIAAGVAGFFRNVPFVSHAWASTVNPLTKDDEAIWARATPRQRADALASTGLVQTINEAPGMLVGFLGAGSVAGSIAAGVKGTATVGGNLLKAYDTVLNLSKLGMATGITGATVAWSAAAAFPDNEFIQNLTQRIDTNRPVSESYFAGLVNAVGMFSSGTFGANSAVRMDSRIIAKLVGASKVPDGIGTITRGVMSGMPDLRTYAWGFGGSPVADYFVSHIGLPLMETKVGIQRMFMSESLNTLKEEKLARIVGAVDNPEGSALGAMSTDEVLEVQAMQLARAMESAADDGEHIVRSMATARTDQPLGFWIGGADKIREWAITVRNARGWDDKIARRFVNQYGSSFIHRLTGADTPETMRKWMADKLNMLGYKGDALPSAGSWNVERWRQSLRLVYHFDFNRWSDAIAKAAVGAEEASRISIMSLRHLFRDEAEAAIVVLRGEDEAAALAMMEKIKTKIEMEAWQATQIRYSTRAGEGAPIWEATPKAMADHIEDIYETLSARRMRPPPGSPQELDALNFVHAKMEDEGLWTVGYKPVNEAGDFVAAVHTRTGQIVQTRWLDYPLDNVWNVELGNRGLLAAKLDEVTRGFRTWRLLEFQKASLHRALSAKTDVSAAQIEAFHQGVMDLGRKHNVSPQAVGRMPGGRLPAPGLRSISQDVNDLAERIFGGPVIGKDGKVVNWRKEVGDAYRQSYRLNLTAGLTSHLKANFGPMGEAITYGSDFIYVMWRFGLSPLFKAGEIWESSQLNLMRRVYPGEDPYVASLYVGTWGGDPGVAAMEASLDPFISGMASPAEATPGLRARLSPARESVVNRQAGLVAETAQRRSAAAFGFYARGLPEDQAAAVARSAMREQAKRYRAQALGGEAIRTNDRGRLMAELANSVDENGVLVNGADYTRLRTVLRQLNREDLDPQVAAALDAYPWGAPTVDQVREAANMRAQAEVLRDPVQFQKADGTLDEDALMQTWRGMQDTGWMEPDAALTLRDRYDELLATLRTERENSRKVAAGQPVDPDWVWPDLTDPVTGDQLLRSVLNASDREFSTAIRSISQRRVHVKVTVPSPEELAHRLDIAAEATLSPKPILRSDRVGPEGAIPADFTTDPAQVYVRGSTNRSHAMTPGGAQYDADGNLILSTAQDKEGVLDWLDLDNTTPEDRVMLHTTTNIDAVNDTGLFSRYELMERGTPPEAIAALKAAADAGTPASSIRVVKRDGSSVNLNYLGYEKLVDGRAKLIHDSWTNDDVPWEEIARITDSVGDIWTNTGTAAAPRGLGAHGVDKMISMTTDRVHADTIAERLGFLSQVARDEVDGADVIRHFYNGYDELTGGDISSVYEMASALNLHSFVNATEDWAAEEQLARAIDRKARGAADPAQYLFDATLTLDKHLHRAMRDMLANNGEEGFTHGVILIITKEQAARIRPEQIGVVQVAVRQSKPAVLAQGSPEWEAARDAVWARIGPGGDLENLSPQVVILNETGGQYSVRAAYRPGGGRRAQFDYIWEQETRNYTPGGPSGVLIRHEKVGGQPGDAWETTVIYGSEGERQFPRVGPDQFELQAHSNDVFVIDRRIDAEPLADDVDGLLRQLRQVIDDNDPSQPIPGYEHRHEQIIHDLNRLRDESINPDPVSTLADIPEEPAGITANLIDRVRARGGKINEEFWDPVPGKEAKMDRLTIQMMREEFPRVTAGTGVEQVFRDMGIPEQQRADFLVTDRALLDAWTRESNPARKAAAFQRLAEHAGGVEDRAALDALYASEEWEVISGLWSLNFQGASEEAFGVHFFDQYRSPLLRSINHPVLGVYPAAWAVKTAREWAKFLFDNRMFGVDLRLGMTPAVAVSEVSRAQQIAFAQDHPDYKGTLEDYMREGPLGSTIFVFNLLMPGDWSALPFPLSRTLREVLRTWPNVNPGDIMAKNVQYMGVTRDLRLMSEMGYEAKDLLFPPEPKPNAPRPKTWTSTPKRDTPKWYDVPTR